MHMIIVLGNERNDTRTWFLVWLPFGSLVFVTAAHVVGLMVALSQPKLLVNSFNLAVLEDKVERHPRQHDQVDKEEAGECDCSVEPGD